MLYVNKNIKGFYWEGYELDSSSYEVGYSYQDFLDGFSLILVKKNSIKTILMRV